jgi:hypothetical protein
MHEISYQIFKNGKPLTSLSDKEIRSIAYELDISLEETFIFFKKLSLGELFAPFKKYNCKTQKNRFLSKTKIERIAVDLGESYELVCSHIKNLIDKPIYIKKQHLN